MQNTPHNITYAHRLKFTMQRPGETVEDESAPGPSGWIELGTISSSGNATKKYFASSDPRHGIQFIPSDIVSGKSSGILSGILFDILSGILSGISSGILSVISSDILSGISIWHSVIHIF